MAESLPEVDGIDEFCQGVPETFSNDDKTNVLYVLDDLMTSINSQHISDLFTKYSHHLNISVIVLLQNVFTKGEFVRTMSLNTKYLVMFNNVRDKQQFAYLARQIEPHNSKELLRIYNEATNRPHGYLICDFQQEQSPLLRYRTNIFEKYHSGEIYCNLSLKNEKVKQETFNQRQVFVIYD